jgi:hypothetical protein
MQLDPGSTAGSSWIIHLYTNGMPLATNFCIRYGAIDARLFG